EKRVPVFDKFSERILTNLADVGSRPLCQINRDRLSSRHLIASYPYTGTQNSNYEPNTLHRATVRICSLGSKCDIMRVLKIFNVNIFAAARNTEDFLAFELQRWGHQLGSDAMILDGAIARDVGRQSCICRARSLKSSASREQGLSGATEHIGGNDKNDRYKGTIEAVLAASQPVGEGPTRHPAEYAARNELGRDLPVDETGERVIDRRREAEGADCEERRADCIDHWHAGRQDQTWHDQEPAANAEEPRRDPNAGSHQRGEPTCPRVGLSLAGRRRFARDQH